MVDSGVKPLIDGKLFITTLLVTGNIGIIGGFFLKYFSEWKPMIRKKFRELDMNDKYQHFSDRFNSIK